MPAAIIMGFARDGMFKPKTMNILAALDSR
jgi:hypothetical protein